MSVSSIALARAFVAALLPLVLAACNSGGETARDEGGAIAGSPTVAAPADPAAEDGLVPLPQPAGEGAVGVRLVEYRIDLTRDTVTAGPHRFHVVNAGTTSHMFIVRDQDNYSATQHLAPGDSTVLEVVLEPGEYNVLCDVRDEYSHLSEGMFRALVVL